MKGRFRHLRQQGLESMIVSATCFPTGDQRFQLSQATGHLLADHVNLTACAIKPSSCWASTRIVSIWYCSAVVGWEIGGTTSGVMTVSAGIDRGVGGAIAGATARDGVGSDSSSSGVRLEIAGNNILSLPSTSITTSEPKRGSSSTSGVVRWLIDRSPGGQFPALGVGGSSQYRKGFSWSRTDHQPN